MGEDMTERRCEVCEELMERPDVCEACLRHNYEAPPPRPAGRKPWSIVEGVCIRGHDMRWDGERWRCKPCDAMYAERKRDKRRTEIAFSMRKTP